MLTSQLTGRVLESILDHSSCSGQGGSQESSRSGVEKRNKHLRTWSLMYCVSLVLKETVVSSLIDNPKSPPVWISGGCISVGGTHVTWHVALAHPVISLWSL